MITMIFLFMTIFTGEQDRKSPEVGFMFPELSGGTLSGHQVSVPDDLRGNTSLVIVAFRRGATPQVNSWMNPFLAQYRDVPGVKFVEIPLLDSGWKIMAPVIDGGMRSGIPSNLHDNVITVYGGVSEFMKETGITEPRQAHVFLLDASGRVVWRANGYSDKEKLDMLFKLTEGLRSN